MSQEIVKLVNTDDIKDETDSLFELEREKLSMLLPSVIIEHIGSTAVPGALTKGDVDLNIRVVEEEFEPTVVTLNSHYAINQPENWSKEFASFKDDSRNLGVQVTVVDSSEDYFVAQREYLKSHPETLIKLNNLKKQFGGKSMDDYREAKGKFYEKLNAEIFSADPDA